MMLRRVSVLGATLLVAVLAAIGPAAAAPPVSTGKGEVGVLATEVWNCVDLSAQALCTTTNARLNMRTQPNTSSGIVTTLDLGDTVWLHCWTAGQSINGDTVWYWVTLFPGFYSNPITWPVGWVAGYYLNTGPDPHPSVGHC